ncbi:hypothetical protein QH494_23965 [Sphingomonas sp. AR_OL41]|nr:hypothetical protein [Sphingomonas sp. AR_OL41]
MNDPTFQPVLALRSATAKQINQISGTVTMANKAAIASLTASCDKVGSGEPWHAQPTTKKPTIVVMMGRFGT